MTERPTHREYFFEVVRAVALRSTCDRGRAGAVLVRDNRIIATGYAGAPAGFDHCDESGHLMESRHWMEGDSSSPRKYRKEGTEHCARTVHAELNALLQAARHGPPADGAEIYCTMMPCRECTKALINAGIVAVHAIYDYHVADVSRSWLMIAGILTTVEKEELNYDPGRDEVAVAGAGGDDNDEQGVG